MQTYKGKQTVSAEPETACERAHTAFTDQLQYFPRFVFGCSALSPSSAMDAAAERTELASCWWRGLPGPRRRATAVAAWEAAAAVRAALRASCSCCCCNASAALMGLKKRNMVEWECATVSVVPNGVSVFVIENN